MNFRIISYILGLVLVIEGGFLLLPALVGLWYGESVLYAYLVCAVFCGLCGLPFILKKPKQVTLFAREGFLTVAVSWILLSLLGALPFVISGEIPNYIDALFETVSGFTTTGASILPNVEVLSHAANFWRCFTHWVGGMGVLVFLLAVLPMAGGSQMYLMRAESPGPSVSKLVPKTRYTALILYALYVILTVLEFLFLLAGKMPVFDALCTTFGTAGTGGFGIKADSIAGYSPYLQWVIAVFMMLFGINFNVYFLLLMRKWKSAFSSEEVRVYLGIILCATLLVFWNAAPGTGTEEGLRTAFFQVASIITTTGFSTCNFDLWPTFSKVLLVLLMFCGACAGSTGGGIKVSRILIWLRRAKQELHRFLHPNSVTHIRMDGKVIESDVIHTTSAYLIAYTFLFALSVLLVSAGSPDTTTAFTAVAATFNNIGPGLSAVGPAANYAAFPPLCKLVLTMDMLIGRLELFPVLLLFHPQLWKGAFRKAGKRI